MGAQWFPKVGVLWHGAWNCHQYHDDTEFFSDFGTYNVNLRLPERYIVGASGIQTGEEHNSDGTKTLSFRGEDIHDFAWAASPHFQVADDTFVNSLGPVKLHALILASHADESDRYLSVLKQTMQKFDEWYGPYPYKQITLIDPEPGSEYGRNGISDADHRRRRTGGSRHGCTTAWRSRSPTSLATSTGTAWSLPMNSKNPGSTKASTVTAKTK